MSGLAHLAGASENTDCFSAKGYPANECPVYDSKYSDGEVAVILDLSGVQTTPLLLSFPSFLWPGMIASNSILSISQIELNCVFVLN